LYERRLLAKAEALLRSRLSLHQTLEHVRARLNKQLALTGIVACRVTRTRVSTEVLEPLAEAVRPYGVSRDRS
jgi:hypothetical protein